MRRGNCVVFPLLALALSLCLSYVDAASSLQPPVKLIWHYYKVHKTCDDAEVYIQYQVKELWNKDKSITAKLLRLLYSDCFVTGCDASILLDGPNSEKAAPQNRGLGGFVVIDKIKTVLEKRCPGVVSCADILNLATRDAVHLAGAPSYPVFTGRRDGRLSSAASVDLPSPSTSWETALAYFRSKGLDVLDLATLLGAHSLGRTHCSYVVDRLYNFNGTGKPDPSMDASFITGLKRLCPQRLKKGQIDPLVFLNPESGSNYKFTQSYYSRIKSHKAVLEVDQQLLFGNDTAQITDEFAAGFEDLRKSFALSMSRMGNINVLTAKEGEIRRNCRLTN
ncbi:probable peroxidase 61 [Fagus crenata]